MPSEDFPEITRPLFIQRGAKRILRTLKTGAPMCVTVTILDGLVLARSARIPPLDELPLGRGARDSAGSDRFG